MATQDSSQTHPDHDYIVARQERYLTAWRSGDVSATMRFMDKNDFAYSNRADPTQDTLTRAEVRESFEKTFENFQDLNVKTISLQGHKHFTAWEWELSCKSTLDEDGERHSEENCPLMHYAGCTLTWWNDNDKIVKQHEYMQRQNMETSSTPGQQ